jgi:hypothetical protein
MNNARVANVPGQPAENDVRMNRQQKARLIAGLFLSIAELLTHPPSPLR